MPFIPTDPSALADPDTYAKAAMNEAAKTGCQAAVTAYGNPELAPLCGPLASVVVDALYPIAKALLVTSFEKLGEAIRAILPDAWFAEGVFDPGYGVVMWWGASSIPQQWHDAVSALEAAWAQGRKEANLPPAPFKVPTQIEGWAANAVASAVGVSGSKRQAQISKLNAEALLYHILNDQQAKAEFGDVNPTIVAVEAELQKRSDRLSIGWANVIHFWTNVDYMSGEAHVWIGPLPGKVQNAVNMPVGPTGNPTGQGPFSVGWQGIPPRCNQDCKDFVAAAVQMGWATRLLQLKYAMPIATMAVAHTIATEKLAGKSSGVAKALVGAVAVGGLGYAAYHYGWIKSALKWLR